MMIPIIGGAYQARSLLSGAQRCVNLYPENNPEGSQEPVVLLPTPGLVLVATASAAGWRGLYTASNGECYGVAGDKLYQIFADYSLTERGTLTALSSPVKMYDNGIEMAIVDGSTTGYSINLASHVFSTIVDPNFLGSNHVAFLDTYLLFNQPATRNFFGSDSNALTFDPLWIAAKSGQPDLLLGVAVTHRDIWLIGAKNTEIWYDAAPTDASFPFQITQGAFVDHGCAAIYSIATHGSKLFWLAADKDGFSAVFMAEAYKVKNIATPAMAFTIASYGDISNARAFTYSQEKHIFYVMNFPSANGGRGATWAYDLETNLWHERIWLNGQGQECMIRADCATFFNFQTLLGDRENGKLYRWDLNTYTDLGEPIIRRRGLPPLVAEGKRVSFGSFLAHMEVGNAPSTLTSVEIFLRWSDDNGKSYGTAIGQTLGLLGEYKVQPLWTRLGTSRYRCFELFWALNAKTSLQAAYLPKAKPY